MFGRKLASSKLASSMLLVMLLVMLAVGCQPPATPPGPPAAPPGPLQIVRVMWCLVDDAVPPPPPGFFAIAKKSVLQNPGAPNMRFNAAVLLRALQIKNQIYAPAGIQFVANGIVQIRDPNPNKPPFAEGGEVADVVDPGGGLRDADRDEVPVSGGDVLPDGRRIVPRASGRAQVNRIIAACQHAVGSIAPEMLLEIVIRRFVDAIDDDADGAFDEDTAADGVNDDALFAIFGDGEDPIRQSPLLGLGSNSVALVIDPGAVPGAAGQKVPRFGQVLAHENGHALGLPHAGAGAAARLMSPRVPPWGLTGLTAAEINQLRAGAGKLSYTTYKNEDGAVIARTTDLARLAVDRLGDAVPGADIFSLQATRRREGGLRFEIALNHLLEEFEHTGYTYFVWLDADNDGNTGEPGRGGLGFDLALSVRVTVDGALASSEATLARYEHGATGGVWRDVAPADLPAARFERIVASSGDVGAVPLRDAVVIDLNAEALGKRLAEGFRLVAAAATLEQPAAILDRTPVLSGTLRQYAAPATIQVSAMHLSGTDPLTLTGTGFQPSSSVVVYWGEVPVATRDTTQEGAFAATIQPPADGNAHAVRFADGTAVVPLLVVDAYGRGALCWLYLE